MLHTNDLKSINKAVGLRRSRAMLGKKELKNIHERWAEAEAYLKEYGSLIEVRNSHDDIPSLLRMIAALQKRKG